MKKLLTLLLLCSSLFVIGQNVPDDINYQSVLRNSNGSAVPNQNVSIRFSILQGSVVGTFVFQEEHSITTSDIGLINLKIGEGLSTLNSLSSINWSLGPYFLEIEVDTTSTGNYISYGTSELSSVPYSLYSKSSASSAVTDSLSPIALSSLPQFSLTEAQVDSMVANNGYLTTEVDGSITNEIQDLVLSSNNLSITNNTSATTVDLSGYLDNTVLTETQVDAYAGNNGYLTTEVDGSITNEIQVLSISNDTLFLSDGGFVKLSSDNVTGIVAIANGGTGSATQNFVDLTADQAVAGTKTFSNDLSVNGITVGIGAGTGTHNTASGDSVLLKNTTGYINSAFGNSALKENTSGNGNTALGNNALNQNTTGSYNSALGNKALNSNTTGIENAASGAFALRQNLTGVQNSAFGNNGLFLNTTGNSNTALGYNALNQNETGSSNTALGHSANVDANDLNNATALGYGAIVTASNTIQLGNTSITDVKTSGTITAGDITIPNTDGTDGQVLVTDGNGALGWATTSITQADSADIAGFGFVAKRTDVVIGKLTDYATTIAKVGNLEIRYSSNTTGGELECRGTHLNSISTSNSMVYATRKSYDPNLPGSTTVTNHRQNRSISPTTWTPLFNLWNYNSSSWADPLTLSTYQTIEGTLTAMGNGSTLPNPEFYKFWVTLDGYNQIVIRLEYTN